jgi:RNA polymerase sigma factor (sigma-70 family)
MTRSGDKGRNGLARIAIRCQPDSRLVRLVREGHDSAFEEIVRRYRAPLVAYAGGIVPSHRAEDVVQEALTRAHSALCSNLAEMRLKPWLFTIVRNGALNALRNEPLHVHLDESYDGVPQPPDVAARREELAALTASVKKLPDQQREALVKRELEGRSHDEIAASLGLSAGAVRGLIYRARAALRDGAGILIPLPVLRALLNSTTAAPEASGAAGAAAAGLAGGGGGVALKAGATLGVAVIAVQHRDSGSARDPASTTGPARAVRAHGTDGSSRVKLADAALPSGGDRRSAHEGPGSSGPGGGDGSAGSGGPGRGGHPGGERSSGPGSGTGGSGDGSGHGGSGSTGDDGTSDSRGSSGSGNDGGGSSTSGHDAGGGGSSATGSDEGTTDGGGDGGSSGSGSGGDGGGDTTTTQSTTTTDGGGD